MTTTSDDYDSPWKDILENYLPDFFAFFFPHIHAEIELDTAADFSGQRVAAGGP